MDKIILHGSSRMYHETCFQAIADRCPTNKNYRDEQLQLVEQVLKSNENTVIHGYNWQSQETFLEEHERTRCTKYHACSLCNNSVLVEKSNEYYLHPKNHYTEQITL